jgi:hypothetical protein
MLQLWWKICCFVCHFFTQKKEKRVLLNKRWPLLLPFFVVQGTGYRFWAVYSILKKITGTKYINRIICCKVLVKYPLSTVKYSIIELLLFPVAEFFEFYLNKYFWTCFAYYYSYDLMFCQTFSPPSFLRAQHIICPRMSFTTAVLKK